MRNAWLTGFAALVCLMPSQWGCPGVDVKDFADCLTEACAGAECEGKIKPGFCYVDNQCWGPDQSPPNQQCVLVCDPTKIQYEFVTPCDSGQVCTGNNVCVAPDASPDASPDATPDAVADAPVDTGPELGPETSTPDASDVTGDVFDCATNPNLGQPCDGDDSDECENGTFTCNAAGTALECVNESITDIVEICDTIDNDCDGDLNEGVTDYAASDCLKQGVCGDALAGGTGLPTAVCNADGTWTCDYSAVADFENAACPGGGDDCEASCDGLDNNCDGFADAEFMVGTGCDGDDPDQCANGVIVCASDGVSVVCEESGDAVEICDGLDNDCDGATDEDFAALGDACDSDDSDQCANGVVTCAADGVTTECVETIEDIPELCDGLDNDCDGATDEDFANLAQPCDSDDSDLCANGEWTCTADGSATECLASNESEVDIVEICDTLDNDCDGDTDPLGTCPGDVLWQKVFGGANGDNAQEAAAAPDGGVIIGATASPPLDIEPGNTVNGFGGGDVLVVRYGPDGTLVWATALGSSGGEEVGGVAVASDGAVYVTGHYQNEATFGSFTLAESGSTTAFVARLDYATGAVQWAKRMHGGTAEFALGLALSPDDAQVVVCGMHADGANIQFGEGEPGGQTFDNISSGYDAWVAWFNTVDGTYVTNSAHFWGGTGDDYCTGLAVRPNGSAIAVGVHTAGTSLPTNYVGGADGAIVSVSATSGIQWATSFGSATDDVAVQVASNANGFYVAAQAGTGAVFGQGEANETTVGGLGTQATVAAFNGSGLLQWVRWGEGGGDDFAQGIALTSDAVYIGGGYPNNIVFGAGTANETSFGGPDDGFVARYDLNGTFVWAKALTGTGVQRVTAVTATSDGLLYGSGYFQNSVTFGAGGPTETGIADNDAFVFKFAP